MGERNDAYPAFPARCRAQMVPGGAALHLGQGREDDRHAGVAADAVGPRSLERGGVSREAAEPLAAGLSCDARSSAIASNHAAVTRARLEYDLHSAAFFAAPLACA